MPVKKKKQNLKERAIDVVPAFAEMDKNIHIKLFISGRSSSTYKNYISHLAAITMHFKKLPIYLTQSDIDEYLFHLKINEKKYSLTYFKHTVYSLKLVFDLYELSDLSVVLPSIKRPKILPVVLTRLEVIRIMNQPKLYTHRMMIAVLYGCGLRCSEVTNIRTADVDLNRKILYVQPGKNRKDRILPLGNILSKMLREYIDLHRPQKFLFHGVMNRKHDTSGRRFSARGLQHAVRMAAQVLGLKKHVHVHTLRHTFATHLLEDGIDIGTIQKLMGHCFLSTTLQYLHIAQYEKRPQYNLMDHLQGARKHFVKQLAMFDE